MYVEFSLALETLSSKFLAAKKAIKIIPMGVDDKAQPYLAWSNLFRTQTASVWPKRWVVWAPPFWALTQFYTLEVGLLTSELIRQFEMQKN